MDNLLTPRVLAFPVRLASRWARPGTEAHEELVAVGNLALAGALRRFRHNPCRHADPGEGFRIYAWVCVRLGIRDAVFDERARRLASLDAYGAHQVADYRSATAEESAALEPLARLDRLLEQLPADDRELYRLHVREGLTQQQAGARLGFPGGFFRQQDEAHRRFVHIKARLARLAGAELQGARS